MTILHNRLSKDELKQKLAEETFERTTISFYRYVIIENVSEFRDELYVRFAELECLGRIYVAREGINAQMSLPTHNLDEFLNFLDTTGYLKDMPIKYAVEDDGKSFYKLIVRLRDRILADGLEDDAYDVTNVGKHLSAIEFHDLAADEETLIIDMRNSYESEIGHFENAVCPDADTFRDEIQMVTDEFKNQKDKKVLLYCTGGIRCEKASAYMKHMGFKDVNQLHGGIIEYARQINEANLKSRFVGSNFVFDNRMSESIDDQIISNCHQCGEPSSTHVNCANDACHLLFIQCESCAKTNNGCCSEECNGFIELPDEVQKDLRKTKIFNGTTNGYRSLRKRLENSK
ncbi:MAG: rhodanese-related sulfurtransferase [Lentimicrobiaceae bacterium]|jgi:UPF0176 protein|nr:rhodanese-related sulfurtransferase [Lentimicrobiaceae bacterium]MBT3454829.1 rhodanese-related sulfurtransferase [Lentimicrobiaceae bacterium]MBT3817828.1 rhodanese-related sulfurtransferase [Lentimicrobiaceae bacterium]MBT4061143.1 rhodanese-related sulfurtransferase [Lentimicrobiaceae bacterium]MBT4190714.1 rhodanese-related sulfurtransferase [Lentimicrobiaceae bacterium]